MEPPLFGGLVHQNDRPALIERAKDFIKGKFLRVDFGRLDPIGFGKKPENEYTIVSFGPKDGETTIFKKDGSGLLEAFTTTSKTRLGQKLRL